MTAADAQNTPETLEELRQAIDAIDDKLVALLKERIGVVHKVGKLKEKTAPGQCPIRAGREARQMQRISRTFEDCDFSPAAAVNLWRVLISASLAVEGNMAISTLASPENMSCWWQAGTYFGNFTPIIRQTASKRVLADLVEGKACVGVLPAPRLDDTAPWWTDMTNLDGKHPVIFARIPFLPETAKNAADPAFAIAMVDVEPSENDLSYYALTLDENVSMHRLQSSFTEAGLEAKWVGNHYPQPGIRQILAEVTGFFAPDNEAIAKVTDSLGASLLQHVFLGSIAIPLPSTKTQDK